MLPWPFVSSLMISSCRCLSYLVLPACGNGSMRDLLPYHCAPRWNSGLTRQMSVHAAEEMSAVETGQMSAVERTQVPSVETRQM